MAKVWLDGKKFDLLSTCHPTVSLTEKNTLFICKASVNIWWMYYMQRLHIPRFSDCYYPSRTFWLSITLQFVMSLIFTTIRNSKAVLYDERGNYFGGLLVIKIKLPAISPLYSFLMHLNLRCCSSEEVSQGRYRQELKQVVRSSILQEILFLMVLLMFRIRSKRECSEKIH